MEQVLRFTVHGEPIAQKRAKFRHTKTKAGKVFGMAYSTQETEAGKFAHMVAQQLPRGFVPHGGPVQLSAWFVSNIPKSDSKKKRAAKLSGEIEHIKKPDLDNLVKFVKDCLKRVVWLDDCQVCRYGFVEKVYGEHPRTEIEVRLIGGDNGERQVEPV